MMILFVILLNRSTTDRLAKGRGRARAVRPQLRQDARLHQGRRLRGGGHRLEARLRLHQHHARRVRILGGGGRRKRIIQPCIIIMWMKLYLYFMFCLSLITLVFIWLIDLWFFCLCYFLKFVLSCMSSFCLWKIITCGGN